MAIEVVRDMDGLEKALKGVNAEMKQNKQEHTALNEALKYNSDDLNLYTQKQEILERQLKNVSQQIALYDQMLESMRGQMEQAGGATDEYTKEIIKLEQSKKKLEYAEQAYEGQLEQNIENAYEMTGVIIKQTEATEKLSEANEKNQKSLIEMAKEGRKSKADIKALLDVFNNGISTIFSLNNIAKDWNATLEDGTPKMDAQAKVMAVLSIATAAVGLAMQLSKMGIVGLFIGIPMLIGGIAALAMGIQSATESVGKGVGDLNSYNGVNTSVNKINTQRTVKQVDYTMNINANQYAQSFARNPQVIKSLTNAVDYELGAKRKR